MRLPRLQSSRLGATVASPPSFLCASPARRFLGFFLCRRSGAGLLHRESGNSCPVFARARTRRIRVDSDYQLRNTGNQPLASLELRLPGRRSFHLARAEASWDGVALAEQSSPVIPRNTVLAVPMRWNVSERHTLHLFAEFQTPAPGETGLSFTSDAFFLPSEGWAPELLPSQGLFATGGVPPKLWLLQVRVPDGFLVHSSGRPRKTSRSASEITVSSLERPGGSLSVRRRGALQTNSSGHWRRPQSLSLDASTRTLRAFRPIRRWSGPRYPGLRCRHVRHRLREAPAALGCRMSRSGRLLSLNGICLRQSLERGAWRRILTTRLAGHTANRF